jgi:triacylglycerol lipase
VNWIATNLVWWVLLAIGAGAVCFFSKKKSMARLLAGGCNILFVVLFLLGGCHLLVSAPGLEDTEKERDRDKSKSISKHIDRLRAAWDSEEAANWPVAETLGLFCQIAYQPPVDAKDSFKKLGVDSVETIVDGSMVGYVITVADVTVVVFRGTDDDFDWFCNLDSFTTPTLQGPIHEGFQKAYLPLKPQITKLLDRQRPKHLWLTGHSLGGALAVVSAHDLIENEHLVVHGVMTFGQPMVASEPLAVHLDKVLLGKFAHFVNDADIVARVPPFLKHCGSLVWFTQDGIQRSKSKRVVFGASDKDQPPVPQDDVLPPVSEKEFEEAKATMRKQRGPRTLPDGRPIMEGNLPFLKDHSMALYLEKIRKNNGGVSALIPPPREEGK